MRFPILRNQINWSCYLLDSDKMTGLSPRPPINRCVFIICYTTKPANQDTCRSAAKNPPPSAPLHPTPSQPIVIAILLPFQFNIFPPFWCRLTEEEQFYCSANEVIKNKGKTRSLRTSYFFFFLVSSSAVFTVQTMSIQAQDIQI